MHLTKEDDEFVRDRLRWVVQLNNGEMIYEDDGRPGIEPTSAWVRLKAYCTANGLHITSMWLQFRSNRVSIGEDAPGYFFSKMAFGVWGEAESYQGYIAGVYDGVGNVTIQRYRVPGLELMGEPETREISADAPTIIIRGVDKDGNSTYNEVDAHQSTRSDR